MGGARLRPQIYIHPGDDTMSEHIIYKCDRCEKTIDNKSISDSILSFYLAAFIGLKYFTGPRPNEITLCPKCRKDLYTFMKNKKEMTQ